jgi:hypothetical protein
MAKAENIIKKVLEQEFKNVEIISIELREASEFEDNDNFYVTVVFKSNGPLDSKTATGFVRHLRPKLHEIKEDRFPVVSFVSRDDWEPIGAAG